MSRYIDADKLEPDTEWDEYDDRYVSYSQLQIDNAPTADVRENVRGKWKYTEEERGQTYPIIRCSICGFYVGGEWHFCPNCGADMRGGYSPKCC